MERVILYGSCYGTTQRCAEELGRRTGIPIRSVKDCPDLSGVRQVIHLGGLYAGGVCGLKRTLKLLPPNTDFVVVTVGLADANHHPEDAEHICRSVERQLPHSLFNRTKLFHLRGAIDYGRLTFRHKLMMSMLVKHLKAKAPEALSDEDRLIIDSYGGALDLTDDRELVPIVEFLQP